LGPKEEREGRESLLGRVSFFEGYEEDIRLAQNTRNIHLIVGGHSHTPLGGEAWYSQGPYPTIVKNLDGEEVFIVTSYRFVSFSLSTSSLSLSENSSFLLEPATMLNSGADTIFPFAALQDGENISVASTSPLLPTLERSSLTPEVP